MRLTNFVYVSLFAMISAKREAPTENTYITYDSEWTYEPVESTYDYSEPAAYSY